MAKTIQLTKAPPTTATAVPQVPPPAVLPPGLRGNIPLPGGRPVTLLDPKFFTEVERSQLKKIGWVEGQPIPSTLSSILKDVQTEAAREIAASKLRPAVDPSTPPIAFKPVPLEQLTPEQQAKIKRLMHDAVTQAAQLDAAEQAPPPVPASEPAKTIQEAKRYDIDPLPVERPAAPGNVEPAFEPPATNPKISDAIPTDANGITETGIEPGRSLLLRCPHCNWDLTVVDTPVPDAEDRVAYAEAVAGGTVFSKSYELFGGRVKLWFRELTTPEIDAIFRQVFAEREAKKHATDMDLWERINRLRLCLQLARMTTDKGHDHEMPDGFTPRTNPTATAYWELPADVTDPLVMVENWLMENVLTNASVYRLAARKAAEFNRLVARLEALNDDENFWKASASPA